MALLVASALIIIELALVFWFSAENRIKAHVENPNIYSIPLRAILEGLIIMVFAISGPIFVVASAVIQFAKRSATWKARRNLLFLAAAIALGVNAFLLSDGLSDIKVIAYGMSFIILPAIAMAYIFGIFTRQEHLKRNQKATTQ